MLSPCLGGAPVYLAPPLCPLRGSRGWESGLARLGPLKASRAARDVGKGGDLPSDARLPPAWASSHRVAPPAAPSSCLSRGRHAPRPAHAHLPGCGTRTPTGHHFAAATPGARVRLPATSDLSEHQAASAPRSCSPCAPTTAPRGLPAPTLRCAPSTVTEHRAPRLGGPWGHAREGAGPARVLSPQPQDGAGATGSRGKRPLRSCLGRTPGSRAEALHARIRDPSPLPPAGEGLPGGARLSARASLGSNPGHPLSEEKDPETAPRSRRMGCLPHT